ncbi:hypothetical protein KSF78_0009470 [Schistosoma japonicum]|nr:hypothetical protein KSF78_0009470 [Schistosoma japonicum]
MEKKIRRTKTYDYRFSIFKEKNVTFTSEIILECWALVSISYTDIKLTINPHAKTEGIKLHFIKITYLPFNTKSFVSSLVCVFSYKSVADKFY